MVAQHKKVVQLLVENGTLRERLHRYDEYNAEQDALLGTLLTKRADEAAVSDSAKCSATEGKMLLSKHHCAFFHFCERREDLLT